MVHLVPVILVMLTGVLQERPPNLLTKIYLPGLTGMLKNGWIERLYSIS